MPIKTVLDVIRHLTEKFPLIRTFKLCSFKSYEPIQNRISLNGNTQVVFEKATAIRQAYSMPFWDCFNLSMFETNIEDKSVFDEIRFHNSIENVSTINATEILNVVTSTQLATILTISSNVTLNDDSHLHLQLLDFHIPVNKVNTQICIGVLNSLKLTGFLLDSGKSYHFYGDKLMDEDSLIDFLAQALLFSPILDRSWIAHQLIERQCHLRITGKYSRQPEVVAHIV